MPHLMIEIPKDAEEAHAPFVEEAYAVQLAIENLDGGEFIRFLIQYTHDGALVAASSAAAVGSIATVTTAIRKAISLLRKTKRSPRAELRVYKDGELLLASSMTDATIEQALKEIHKAASKDV